MSVATPAPRRHVHRHPVVAEKQNEELLSGNTEILKRIEGLEHLILELDTWILDSLPASG